jgi:hypothetical protein
MKYIFRFSCRVSCFAQKRIFDCVSLTGLFCSDSPLEMKKFLLAATAVLALVGSAHAGSYVDFSKELTAHAKAHPIKVQPGDSIGWVKSADYRL